MNFNSRETYLAARSEWRANYNQVSADIRVARREFNEAQKEASKHTYDWKAGYSSDANKAYNAAHAKVEAARSNRAALRTQATELLEEYAAAKVEANKQWLAHTTRPVISQPVTQ